MFGVIHMTRQRLLLRLLIRAALLAPGAIATGNARQRRRSRRSWGSGLYTIPLRPRGVRLHQRAAVNPFREVGQPAHYRPVRPARPDRRPGDPRGDHVTDQRPQERRAGHRADQGGVRAPNLMTIVRSGDSEAVTGYGIGLAKRETFKVFRCATQSPRHRYQGRIPDRPEEGVAPQPEALPRQHRTLLHPVLRPVKPFTPATGVMDRVFARTATHRVRPRTAGAAVPGDRLHQPADSQPSGARPTDRRVQQRRFHGLDRRRAKAVPAAVVHGGLRQDLRPPRAHREPDRPG